jgi:hypothetical protein
MSAAPQVATAAFDWMARLAWRGHTRAGPDSVTMPVMPGWDDPAADPFYGQTMRRMWHVGHTMTP